MGVADGERAGCGETAESTGGRWAENPAFGCADDLLSAKQITMVARTIARMVTKIYGK